MAELKLEHIDKIYDNQVQAVFDFNLDVKDGELIVLVGPSGCGKSTTLRMVAGLEDISAGRLYLDGRDITQTPAKDRDMAMVFQNYALYGHMTVYENMAFSLTLRKENPNVIHKKVMAAAEILDLTEQLNKKPAQLSGGQRQRVAMGRSIVRNPKVFLFDEPLSNLDAKLRGATRREILLLHKRLKATMLYVTHDQTEALTLADRIVCMSMGHVQQVGTPLELYEDPANLFVAGFIGLPPMNTWEAGVRHGYIEQVGTPTEVFEMPQNLFVAEFIGAPKMNIMSTELVKDGNDYYVTPFGSRIPVTGEKGKALLEKGVAGGEILLGVRPEHITLSREKGANTIPCTLEVNEMMGSELHLHVYTEDGTRLIVRVPTVDLSVEERKALTYGCPLNLTFEGKVMHFFDKESTRNLLV